MPLIASTCWPSGTKSFALVVTDPDGNPILDHPPELPDFFLAPDWHPGNHPPMPEVVARGRKPEVFACGFCHRADGRHSGGKADARHAVFHPRHLGLERRHRRILSEHVVADLGADRIIVAAALLGWLAFDLRTVFWCAAVPGLLAVLLIAVRTYRLIFHPEMLAGGVYQIKPVE